MFGNIFIIVIFIVLWFSYLSKKFNNKKRIKQWQQNQINELPKPKVEEKPDIYKIYSSWTKGRNITPISREEFDNLADENGSISLSDLMSMHRDEEAEIKPRVSKSAINDTLEDNKDDNSFVNSAIIGGITKSTTTGFLLGGDLFGAMFGEFLGGDD